MTREEALERIKVRFDKWALDDEDMKAIQTLIPELRDSEDERIRKELIKYHKQQFENNRDQEVGLFHKDALAWLEKQKEQKQEWSEEDEAIVGCIAVCLDGQFVSEAARKQCLEWFNKHRRDFLNRPSWKPSEEQMAALRRAVNKLAKTDVADSVRLSVMSDNLKKL